ncbi:uncharacterized protein LOC124369611 [Homalodisca vitripennis]|uniref:uncharacterized protein LOC124369611 n=1 Tax=Homalodisca vitripennis TaxID=197043 RepID=UPI001EEA21B5|nr:uncharacterized protein LOC124369611 [Homalodisca vitripennis]
MPLTDTLLGSTDPPEGSHGVNNVFIRRWEFGNTASPWHRSGTQYLARTKMPRHNNHSRKVMKRKIRRNQTIKRVHRSPRTDYLRRPMTGPADQPNIMASNVPQRPVKMYPSEQPKLTKTKILWQQRKRSHKRSRDQSMDKKAKPSFEEIDLLDSSNDEGELSRLPENCSEFCNSLTTVTSDHVALQQLLQKMLCTGHLSVPRV